MACHCADCRNQNAASFQNAPLLLELSNSGQHFVQCSLGLGETSCCLALVLLPDEVVKLLDLHNMKGAHRLFNYICSLCSLLHMCLANRHATRSNSVHPYLVAEPEFSNFRLPQNLQVKAGMYRTL